MRRWRCWVWGAAGAERCEVWGRGIPLPTRGGVWLPRKFFDIKMVGFHAFWWYYFAHVYIWEPITKSKWLVGLGGQIFFIPQGGTFTHVLLFLRHWLHSHVLSAIGLVNGNPSFLTPHRIDVPQPIAKKIVTGDYVHDFHSCAKFGGNPSIGDWWANRWNITKIFLFIPPF